MVEGKRVGLKRNNYFENDISDEKYQDASQRISSLFLELLENQFPIDENFTKILFRSPADFANQLNVHVNHLNRVLKETTQKTTSQLIAERILQEAKILLKHSSWSVSEISFALGFTETTYFSHFFKKHAGLSPTKFRHKKPSYMTRKKIKTYLTITKMKKIITGLFLIILSAQ